MTFNDKSYWVGPPPFALQNLIFLWFDFFECIDYVDSKYTPFLKDGFACHQCDAAAVLYQR